MKEPNKNTLTVAAAKCEVIIHPILISDDPNNRVIALSPQQARDVAHVLYRKAHEVDQHAAAIGINQFCKLFQTPQGQLLFMIERGQNNIVSYLGVSGAAYMNSLKYPEAMVEEVFEGIDQHAAEVESAMLMKMYMTSQNAQPKR